MIATGGPPGWVASASVKGATAQQRQSDGGEIIRPDAVPPGREGHSLGRGRRLRPRRRVSTGALHFRRMEVVAERDRRRDAGVFHARQSGEFIVQGPIKILRPLSDRIRRGWHRFRPGKRSRRASPTRPTPPWPRRG